MKVSYLIFLVLFIGCSEKNKTNNNVVGYEYPNDTIPKMRRVINKKPVASYLIPVGDPRLERKFGVEIFETSYTFKYLLAMQYDGMIQNDTLQVPNLYMWPIVEVKAGKEKYSCIIGFLDKQKNFREYKLLSASKNDLKLSVLKSYGLVSNQ